MAGAGIAMKLLEKTGDKVFGSAVSKGFDRLFNLAKGGGDNDKLAAQLSQLMGEVREVKKAVDAMSQKLDAGIQNLRKDSLKEKLTSINTLYWTIGDCFTSVEEVRKSAKSQDEVRNTLASLQASVEDKLKEAARTVPGYLDQADNFLTDPVFVGDAAMLAYKSSKTFLSYYLKMNALVRLADATSGKGDMKANDMQVHTLLDYYYPRPQPPPNGTTDARCLQSVPELSTTIQRDTAKVPAQEALFRQKVGESTCTLPAYVLTSPVGSKSVAFQTGWGSGIGHCIHEKYHKYYQNDREASVQKTIYHFIPKADDAKHKWWLVTMLPSSASITTLDPSKEYWMQLEEETGQKRMAKNRELKILDNLVILNRNKQEEHA